MPAEYRNLVPQVDHLSYHYRDLAQNLRNLAGDQPTIEAQSLAHLVDHRSKTGPGMIFAPDQRPNNLIAESETRTAFDIAVTNLGRVLAGADRFDGFRPIVMYDTSDQGATLSLAETRAMSKELAGLLGTTRVTQGPNDSIVWNTVIPGVNIHIRQPDPDQLERMSFAVSFSRAEATPTADMPRLPHADQTAAKADPGYAQTRPGFKLPHPDASLASYVATTAQPTADGRPARPDQGRGPFTKPWDTPGPLSTSADLPPLPPHTEVKGRNPAAVMYSHLDQFVENIHRERGTREGDLVAFRDLLARRELEVESQANPEIIQNMAAAQEVETALRYAMNHVSPNQGVNQSQMQLYHHEGDPDDPVTTAVIHELEAVFRAKHDEAKPGDKTHDHGAYASRTNTYDMALRDLPGYTLRVERTQYSRGTKDRKGRDKQPDMRILLIHHPEG
jgi:hypothetical protein